MLPVASCDSQLLVEVLKLVNSSSYADGQVVAGEDLCTLLLPLFRGSGEGKRIRVIGGAELDVLVLANVVIGQQRDHLGLSGQRSEEACRSLYVGLIGINAFDEGYTYPIGFGEGRYQMYAGKDAFVGDSCVATVLDGIHVLDVAGFRGIVENCVIAAAERSAELGRK